MAKAKNKRQLALDVIGLLNVPGLQLGHLLDKTADESRWSVRPELVLVVNNARKMQPVAALAFFVNDGWAVVLRHFRWEGGHVYSCDANGDRIMMYDNATDWRDPRWSMQG